MFFFFFFKKLSFKITIQRSRFYGSIFQRNLFVVIFLRPLLPTSLMLCALLPHPQRLQSTSMSCCLPLKQVFPFYGHLSRLAHGYTGYTHTHACAFSLSLCLSLFLSLSLCLSVSLSLSLCVCVCVCERERERELGSEYIKFFKEGYLHLIQYCLNPPIFSQVS